MKRPGISVVVATRDRPAHLAACVATILASPSADFELLVIDQSRSSDGQQALAARMTDARMRYLRSEETGLSRARNRGVIESRGPLVAFTDDDCRVPPGWADGLRRGFEAGPGIDLVFATVHPREDLPRGFFVPGFYPTAPILTNWQPRPGDDWGIGANMALRRELFDKVGVFDALLGAGSPLYAAEETDYTVRTLARNGRVVHSADPAVLHLHELGGREASRHWRGYGVGIGAAFAKHARLQTGAGGSALLRKEIAHKIGLTFRRMLRGETPTGVGFLVGLLEGTVVSLRYRVDRERGVFRKS
jgi:glycosyltransferase involved in cell wall biosynthesis